MGREYRMPSSRFVRYYIASIALIVVGGCANEIQGVLRPVYQVAPGTTSVSMLVATTRARDENEGILFSGERGTETAFAQIKISIPPENVRKIGEVQWPSHLPGNPATDFVTSQVNVLDRQAIMLRFRQTIKRIPGRRVLVFVHGFNNRFEDAVYRFAQIVHDSNANVAPVLFTWPSRGSLFAYGYDRESTNYSRHALEALLQVLVHDTAVSEVSVLAHSMGNWLALESLRQMAIRDGRLNQKIANVMLAAPDVDVDVFQTQVAEIGKSSAKFTLFVSQDDRALEISRRIWGGTARLGEIDPETEPYRDQLKQDDITVIDLTKLRSGDSLNHGKFAESPQIVQLIGTRLISDQPITDSRVGLGERVMEITGGAAATVGKAAGLVISAPIAVADPITRRNFGNKADEVKRSFRDTTKSLR